MVVKAVFEVRAAVVYIHPHEYRPPNPRSRMREFTYKLMADYFQFYLQDETAKGDLRRSMLG
jgi:hypothetical protein